jgi:hypothetical protein
VDGKRKRVTKKESPTQSDVPEDLEGSREEIRYVFKSKFRADKIQLQVGHTIKNPDGSKSVIPDIWAEFERNTWTTRDPERADMLRKQIKQGEDSGRPLHVMETTDV